MEPLHSNKIKTESTVLSAFLMKRRSVLAAEVLGCAADVSLILNTPVETSSRCSEADT